MRSSTCPRSHSWTKTKLDMTKFWDLSTMPGYRGQWNRSRVLGTNCYFPWKVTKLERSRYNILLVRLKVGRNHSVDEEISPEKSTKLSKVILVVSNGAGPDSPSELRALLSGQQGGRGEGCGSMTFDRPADLLWGFMVTMEKWSFIPQGRWCSRSALSNRTFWDQENILDLCCPTW